MHDALLDAAWVLRDQLDPLDPPTRTFLVAVVDAAARDWRLPDQGIWEIRGPARRYLHSAVMCWVALDRGIRLADLLHAQEEVPRWTGVREHIRAAVLEQGWHSGAGAFTQSFGSPDLDASSLLVALVGILPPQDPRLASTVDAVAAGLSDDRGLLYRYRADDGLDGQEAPSCCARSGSPKPWPSPAAPMSPRSCCAEPRPTPTTSGCSPSRSAERRAARQLPAGLQPPRAGAGSPGPAPDPLRNTGPNCCPRGAGRGC